MAVQRRLQTYPGIRVDAPQIRSIESSVSYDFDSLIRGMVTGLNRPMVLRGFRINIPASNIPAEALSVQVSDSAILHSSAAESGTILAVPLGTPDEVLSPTNPNVIGAFQNNATNYVSLQYVREVDPATADQTSGWSQSQELEVQRIVPIARVLKYQFVISTTGFSTNLPLYIVGVSAGGTVNYITKAVPSLFRLGSGGAVPNPQYEYQFGNLTNPQTGTNREWVNTSPLVTNPVSVVPGNPANAFDYGDWAIGSLKDWMDAVMTRFREITNSSYWYINSATSNQPNILDVWFDAAGSVMTGAGYISYNYILEATAKLFGAYQTSFTDNTINPGDSYVIGVTSGRRGTLTNINDNQLIVNSLTGTGFIPGETLQNRRTFPMNYSSFKLTNYADASTRWAHMTRVPVGSPPTTSITSWTFDSATAFMQKVTITAPGHSFNVGDIVQISGLTGTVNPPNGVQWVRTSNPTGNTFTICSLLPISGVPTVSSANVAFSTATKQPYYPATPFASWSYASTTITLSGFSQPLAVQAPVSDTGTLTISSPNVTGLTSTANLKVGQAVTASGGVPSETYITAILSPTSIRLSKNATANGGASFTFFDVIVVSGTTAATNAPNGRWNVAGVTSLGDVQFIVPSAPTGVAGVLDPVVYPDYYQFLVSVTDATPSVYNAVDALAIANGPVSFQYPMGTVALPAQPDATGPIVFDGVVATATVADPVQVQSIQYNAGDLIVTTNTPHNLSNTVSGTVTIFGDPTVTGYAQTYQNVGITVNSPTQFTISATPSSIPQTFPNLGTYTNGGSDQVYLNFPGNPYPGPIQWTSDIIVKGIIGDLFFKIPQTATAAGDPLANKYNVNGVTGTAFLQDKQAMYIVLERNLPVTSGASFVCTVPSSITGTAFLDVHGNPLAAGANGDFVKFEDEDESKWVRIGSYSGGSQINLVSDNGQPPNSIQRPAKTGQLVYCKSTYDVVQVQPHYLVPPTTDVFWFAVRRDNGSAPSKVYFRALELEVGETRRINDETTQNILQYTGAMTEAATQPNYTQIDQTGPWQFTQAVTATAKDVFSRTITFAAAPDLGFQAGDRIQYVSGSTVLNYTIEFPISAITVQVQQDVTPLPLAAMTYFRVDYAIQDQDNLTLGIRKEDRELAKVNTNLTRPVYDESAYVQRVNLNPTIASTTVRSGRYIFTGPISNPTGLAWVLHGTQNVTETIDNQPVVMPGGHPSVGPNAVLAHFLIGGPAQFTDTSVVQQIDPSTGGAVNTGFQINNPGNPAFLAPTIAGASGTGVQLVLPPNRRVQSYSGSGGYNIWPSNAYYSASSSDNLAGEDLMVIANDTIRQAGLDYEEVFGGPKGIIRIVRSLPVNTRLRFRTLATYGSPLSAVQGSVTLQQAYNAGRTVNELSGAPVELNAGDAATGGTALRLAGSLEINGDDGGGNVVGGIKGPSDKKFFIGQEANKPIDTWTATQHVKSHTNSPGSAWTQITADQTTTTASSTPVLNSNVTVSAGATARIQVTAVARETSNAGQAVFRMEGAFYNAGAGPLAAGSPLTVIVGSNGNGSSYAIAFAISGNDVIVDAYGDATTTYWAFTIDYQIIHAAS